MRHDIKEEEEIKAISGGVIEFKNGIVVPIKNTSNVLTMRLTPQNVSVHKKKELRDWYHNTGYIIVRRVRERILKEACL